MKQNCNEITFSRKEIYYYVKFHTKKKLQFKQFLFTPEMDYYDYLMMAAKKFKYDLGTAPPKNFNVACWLVSGAKTFIFIHRGFCMPQRRRRRPLFLYTMLSKTWKPRCKIFPSAEP